MNQLEIRRIQKNFGAVRVIQDLDLTVAPHEFIVMLGQSGCGKTTTLRAVAGLETIDSGEILLAGERVDHLKPSKRDVAFVFQSFSLYPHMTVFENMAFPLKAMGGRREAVAAEVQAVAASLGLAPLLNLRPSALSSGDMQRAAIGRALVRRPQILLMDEPLGALDAKLREEMRAELKRLHVERGSTSVYITHDQAEAMALADRMVILHRGILQQVETPAEIYRRPANAFVAEFVGSPAMVLIEAQATAREGGLEIRFPEAEPVFLAGAALPGPNAEQRVLFGARAEGVLLFDRPAPGLAPCRVEMIEPLGSHEIALIRIGAASLRARTPPGFLQGPGQELHLGLDPAACHLFDPETGLALRGVS